MKTIRNANLNDKKEFRTLWDMSFTDSVDFREWFFENRFIPEYSVCMEEDGKIVSAVQSLPLFLKIRGAVVPATMMVGACTHPDYKKRGYMKALYAWYMNYMHKLNIAICAHTPAVLKTYFYVGHYPVSDSAFIEIDKSNGTHVNDNNVIPIDLKKESAALLKCYLEKAKDYSGIVLRTLSDMRLKCADYMADGAKGIALWENSQLKGYGIYYSSSTMIHGEEIIALNTETEQKIVDHLINLGQNKKVKIKLPPNTKVKITEGQISIIPRNVLGLASIQTLLKQIQPEIHIEIFLDFALEIKDEVVPENNGVFNLRGEKVQTAPTLKASAGHALQWLTGYKSLKELREENLIEIYDIEKAKQLDIAYPKQICHIIDEY